jgi:hypothetical protein
MADGTGNRSLFSLASRSSLRPTLLPHPLPRGFGGAWQGRSTWLPETIHRLQLRDSAGLSPASSLCPGFRAGGHPYRVVRVLEMNLFGGRGESNKKPQPAC